MLKTIIRVSERAGNLIARPSRDARPTLKRLATSLRRESARSLSILARRSADVYPVRELQIAIDNLTNTDAVVRRVCNSKEWIDAERSLSLIDIEIEHAMNLIRSGLISGSMDAGEVVLRTSNLLFTAKQKIKNEFNVITELKLSSLPALDPRRSDLSVEIEPHQLPEFASPRKLVLSSAMLMQIGQSLFPPERMIVGAARQIGNEISVKALFDVTGSANSSRVVADPDRLGRALIAMAESDTYFGLWVHSHPGSGSLSTYPSPIDTTQHADWLRDYSPNLVSAIIVRDRYIRFWGTALEAGDVVIEIEGSGIEVVSAEESVYRLAC